MDLIEGKDRRRIENCLAPQRVESVGACCECGSG